MCLERQCELHFSRSPATGSSSSIGLRPASPLNCPPSPLILLLALQRAFLVDVDYCCCCCSTCERGGGLLAENSESRRGVRKRQTESTAAVDFTGAAAHSRIHSDRRQVQQVSTAETFNDKWTSLAQDTAQHNYRNTNKKKTTLDSFSLSLSLPLNRIEFKYRQKKNMQL